MARGGKFYANYVGYRSIMNGAPGIDACELAADAIRGAATAISGIDYYVDSMRGLNRIHTRVSTVTDSDRFRERRHNALATACASMGGQVKGVKGYRTLSSRVSAVRKSKGKGWKAPGQYRKARG